MFKRVYSVWNGQFYATITNTIQRISNIYAKPWKVKRYYKIRRDNWKFYMDCNECFHILSPGNFSVSRILGNKEKQI